MAGELLEAQDAVKAARRKPIGFNPEVRRAAARNREYEEAREARLRKACEDAARDAVQRVMTTPARRAAEKLAPVDVEGEWKGRGDVLRKRAADASADPVALVKVIHATGGRLEGSNEPVPVAKAAGAPYPHGAVEDARERADSLAKLAASHAIEVSPSRVNDTAQHADAVEAMADVEPERWTPHRGDLDAQAGAHELGTLGGAHSPEEICAALAEAGAGSTAWLDRLRDQDMADAIKKAPRIARFTAPRSA